MFLFLGKAPAFDSLSWLHEDDVYLNLTDSIGLGGACEQLAVRTALMFSEPEAWNIMFCWGWRLPPDSQIDTAAISLNTSQGSYESELLWGVTREKVAVSGFEVAYRGVKAASSGSMAKAPSGSAVGIEPDQISQEIELGLALSGHAVSDNGMALAIKEVIGVGAMSLRSRVEGSDQRIALAQIVSQSYELNELTPSTIIYCAEIDKDKLAAARKSLKDIPGGAVVVLNGEKMPLLELERPYRSFTTHSGIHALLFTPIRH